MVPTIQIKNWTSKIFSLVFIFAVSVILASTLYNYAITKWTSQAAYQVFRALVEHTADAPNRYRILVPFMVEGVSSFLREKPEQNFLVSYFVYYQFGVAFTLTLIFIYLRIWFTRSLALTGVLIVSISMLISFGDGYFQPWSILEIGLFTAGLLAIYKDQKIALAGLIALATLNRETGVFITIAYLLIHLKREAPYLSRSQMIWSGIYFAIGGSIFFGLRIWLGQAPQPSVGQILQMNLNPTAMLMTVLNIFLFLGGYWGLLKSGYITSHPFIRKTWRIVPIYLLVFLIFGIWQEVRLLAILYPILIPTGLGRWETI